MMWELGYILGRDMLVSYPGSPLGPVINDLCTRKMSGRESLVCDAIYSSPKCTMQNCMGRTKPQCTCEQRSAGQS